MEYTEQEIQSIVSRAQEGDIDSLGKIYEIFYERIYRFLYVRLSQKEDVEDLTQTVFLELCHTLPTYESRQTAKFSTWLFQIARFRLIDHYRKQKKRNYIPLEKIAEVADLNDKTGDFLYQDTDNAIKLLPKLAQEVLHLRFREGFNSKETAEILGITAINVRVVQARALRKLRKILKRY